MGAQHPVALKARGFLIKYGGAIYSSTWGKVWMAVLVILHWDAVHPIPLEAWLLPDWVPFAPWRYNAEMRIASQPLSYIYSKKWSCQETGLIREIRREVLIQPFSEIRWKFHRNSVSKIDAKASRSWIMSSLSWTYLNIWEPYMRTESLKAKAESCLSHLNNVLDLQCKLRLACLGRTPITPVTNESK
jgi:lanosterol synthase